MTSAPSERTGTPSVLVRSTWGAVAVPGRPAPYDRAHYRLYHSAVDDGSEEASATGEMTPDTSGGRRPVVLMLSGVNVQQEAYRWLAVELVRAGSVVVTYDHVGLLTPGVVGLSPGVDVAAVAPDVYGTRPTCDVLLPLLDELRRLDADGPLAGLLDLERVALGGHSAGGTVALQSARTSLVPGLRAVFTYAGHTMTSALLPGYEAGTVLAAATDVPVLLLHGTEDGVIAASAARYGAERPERANPVLATFEHGVPGGRDDAYLVELKGANHFVIGDLDDPTSARGFVDGTATVPEGETRGTLGMLVRTFLGAHLHDDPAARAALDELLESPPPTISLARRR